MKKFKLLTVAGSLVIVSSLLAPTMVNAGIVSSGMNCEAANLNQALQGIGWSQAGVKNNSTSPFFVVCPMDWVSNFGTITIASVMATFPGSGTVECTARAERWQTGAYTSVSFTISSGQNTGNPNRGLNLA